MFTVKKRGKAYRAHGAVEARRVRLSLGTRNYEAAQVRVNRIERALAEGPSSAIWSELQAVLPAPTFKRLALSVGYQTPEKGQGRAKPTWADLRSQFEGHMTKRIALGKFKDSTRQRYLQTVKQFETFLAERHIVFLAEIDTPLFEDFKVWRVEKIKAKKFSRNATGVVLDVAIMHKVYQVGIQHKLVTENPVIFEGRPGDSPSRGAQPFAAEQLQALRRHADKDLVALMLLRWTGLRGSDAVALRWEEVHFDTKEIERITQKRSKKVIVPIQSELLALLQMEYTRRGPKPTDTVLLHPVTNIPLTRKRLYERMLALGRRAGVMDAHPHRFRDTFAVDMLARNATPYEVAKLLGDTIETVEKHYADFVKELRERVRRMMDSKDGGLEAFAVAASQDAVPQRQLVS